MFCNILFWLFFGCFLLINSVFPSYLKLISDCPLAEPSLIQICFMAPLPSMRPFPAFHKAPLPSAPLGLGQALPDIPKQTLSRLKKESPFPK
jgi:hypothetical protein